MFCFTIFSNNLNIFNYFLLLNCESQLLRTSTLKSIWWLNVENRSERECQENSAERKIKNFKSLKKNLKTHQKVVMKSPESIAGVINPTHSETFPKRFVPLSRGWTWKFFKVSETFSFL